MFETTKPTLTVELTPKQAYAVLVAFLSRPSDGLLDTGVFTDYQEILDLLQFHEGYKGLTEDFRQAMYCLFTHGEVPEDLVSDAAPAVPFDTDFLEDTD